VAEREEEQGLRQRRRERGGYGVARKKAEVREEEILSEG